MKVFAKLGAPAMNLTAIGIVVRRELALGRRTLLSDRCLQRGLFCADTVREVCETF